MKTIDEIELNQVYWTCEPPIESAGYGESYCRPWQGKVSDICLNYEKTKCFVLLNGNFKLSYFNKETGKCDLDSNAMAYCKPDNIFESEKEVWEYYRSYIYDKQREINEELAFVEFKLKNLN